MDRTEVVAFIIVVLVMIGLPVSAVAYQNYLETGKQAKQPKEFNIFAWGVEDGGWTPNQIVVKKGQTVKIVIWSRDMTHSFVAPDLGIDSGTVDAGKHHVIEFTPDKTGTFPFYCGTLCSPKHHFMHGTIVVED